MLVASAVLSPVHIVLRYRLVRATNSVRSWPQAAVPVAPLFQPCLRQRTATPEPKVPRPMEGGYSCADQSGYENGAIAILVMPLASIML